MTGANTEREALSLYEKSKERMEIGGFLLRKWKTNSEILAGKICLTEEEQISDRGSPVREEQIYAKETLGSHKDAEKSSKVLGIAWDNKNKIGKGIQVNKPTKRIILRSLATLFDPLGLISPIGVQARVLFQNHCVGKVDWDDRIPREKEEEWNEWITGLDQVKSISIPRSVFSDFEGEGSHYDLSTILTEVEGTLNSRPLTYHGEELEEQVLTPSHLITDQRISPLSENVTFPLKSDDIVTNSDVSTRFVYLMTKLDHFWARWHKEYLLGLRETHRLQRFLPSHITEGDTVLVQEERTKRNRWKLGNVEELIRGKDQVIRGAKVRRLVKGKPEILCRPLQKLFQVESSQRKDSAESMIRKEGKNAKEDVNKERNEGLGMKDERPRRAAAENTRVKS